ncbi:MAG: hypothetical protein QNK36_06200 [Colwellia sp.]|nr:hypothetical protein [Colwellia sp.]
MSAEKMYRYALERLINNRPEVLKKGSYKINKKNVALEAGKERTSIKKNRYPKLIDDIEEAAAKYVPPVTNRLMKAQQQSQQNKMDADNVRDRYTTALNRESMLVQQLFKLELDNKQLKTELEKITNELARVNKLRVVPIK